MWWRPGEENQENCALPTVKHGGGSIMVWGYMTTVGTGELLFIEGNMNSNMYCDILKQKMMPPSPPSETVLQQIHCQDDNGLAAEG